MGVVGFGGLFPWELDGGKIAADISAVLIIIILLAILTCRGTVEFDLLVGQGLIVG